MKRYDISRRGFVGGVAGLAGTAGLIRLGGRALTNKSIVAYRDAKPYLVASYTFKMARAP